jgi:16S rRNA (adenine1518-N6/adenine1519-N6)-dimethyltransferase
MTRLGQHFLKNRSVLKKITGALELDSKDVVVEVGPGHGELTAAIADPENGVHKIVAVEKDAKLITPLTERFSKNSSVEIREGDILEVLSTLANEKPFAARDWKLVGNIPYYITGKLLRTIGELKNKPERSVFMVQKEVAERMCAAPPDMNRLAASIQFWTDAKIIVHIPKSDFAPPPKVDSAVVLLKTKSPASKIEPDRYYEFVRALFSQPRKTILNNLAAHAGKNTAIKAKLEDFIKNLGIDPGARPQNLRIEDIESLASQILWG